MLSSALSALTDEFDVQFLTAYWLPAFVAGLGAIGILGTRVGWSQIGMWIDDLDTVEGSLAAVIALLVITMLALVFRALTLPIAALAAGVAWPQALANWSVARQVRTRRTAARAHVGSPDRPASAQAAREHALLFDLHYPREEAETKPTRLGNIVAAAAAYPRETYGMDGAIWWPRLMPLLPSEFAKTLGDAQAPLVALLNVSVVGIMLALLGSAVLVAGTLWLPALLVLFGGLLLARLSYLAAVAQAVELGSLLRIGCDLYRFAILTQMELPKPPDLAAERRLWQGLTDQVLPVPDSARAAAAEKAETACGGRRRP